MVYQRAIGPVQNAADHGESLQEAVAKAGCFLDFIIKIIVIKDQASVLGTMLPRGDAHHEREAENTTAKILPRLEPAMMALLGLVMGVLIKAMYLPVFQTRAVTGG